MGNITFTNCNSLTSSSPSSSSSQSQICCYKNGAILYDCCQRKHFIFYCDHSEQLLESTDTSPSLPSQNVKSSNVEDENTTNEGNHEGVKEQHGNNVNNRQHNHFVRHWTDRYYVRLVPKPTLRVMGYIKAQYKQTFQCKTLQEVKQLNDHFCDEDDQVAKVIFNKSISDFIKKHPLKQEWKFRVPQDLKRYVDDNMMMKILNQEIQDLFTVTTYTDKCCFYVNLNLK